MSLECVKARTFYCRDRFCEACGGEDLEMLWKYSHLTRTREAFWEFNVTNVICRDCGFVFVSLVPEDQDLGAYYTDSIGSYVGQDSDYDIGKRLGLLSRFAGPVKRFVELGSNLQSHFHVGVREMFSQFFRVLAEDGILICEVPDIRKYPNDVLGCHQHEHVNHFSPLALERIARQEGFELIESSVEQCSRRYGFVSVFRRWAEALPLDEFSSEYVENRCLFSRGRDKALEVMDRFKEAHAEMVELIRKGESFVIWGANDNLLQLLYGRAELPGIVCVDSNPAKKQFLPGTDIRTPNEAAEQITSCKRIFLCAGRHRDSILNYVKEKYGRIFTEQCITILDREDP